MPRTKNNDEARSKYLQGIFPIQVWLDGREIYASNDATKDYIFSPFDADALTQGENILHHLMV